ncbi:MAG: hypothetical protein ACR2FP_08160 [Nocardioidaceae bacterium]
MSEIETLQLAVSTQVNGNAWWPYTDVVVTDSESALSSIESTLSSRQPRRQPPTHAPARVRA